MAVCWNGFQMDGGGSRREVHGGAAKSQTILEEFAPV